MKIKRTILIILVVLSIVLIDTVQAKIFNNRPVISIVEDYNGGDVFVKRKCEQKGPKKVSTFSTRFHVVSNVFPKYQMLTF